jgi:competence ComEA-like helix-hairpin-helix protein
VSSGGRKTEGRVPDAPPLPSRGVRHKACLLLSLIVLVGNAVATGVRFLPARAPVIAGSFAPTPEFASAPARDAADSGFVTARRAPLGARQKFLLGQRVDVNRAGVDEISSLPGISDAVARAVVAERERSGGFRRAEDLLRVRGIKERRLKKILPFLAAFPNN